MLRAKSLSILQLGLHLSVATPPSCGGERESACWGEQTPGAIPPEKAQSSPRSEGAGKRRKKIKMSPCSSFSLSTLPFLSASPNQSSHLLECYSLSLVWLFVTPWTQVSALPAPLSMGFSRQEYWSGLPRPPPGDLPDPGIEPRSPEFQADSPCPLLITYFPNALQYTRCFHKHLVWSILTSFHIIRPPNSRMRRKNWKLTTYVNALLVFCIKVNLTSPYSWIAGPCRWLWPL